MTLITQQIRPNPADDAQFRDCVQKIRDGITGVGWVRTNDTGQIDPTTVVKPAAGVVAGYDIFRMADSLQATAPFFLKIEYGIGNTGTNTFGWWPTVGTGTNGAGTLTGNISTRPSSGLMTTGDVGNLRTSTFAGAPNRLVIVLFENHPAGTGTMALVLERSHADDGSDTSERADLVLTSYSTTAQFQMIPTIGQFSIPSLLSSLPILVPTSGSALKGTDVGVFALFPNMAGPLRNPMIGILVFMSGDISLGSEVPIAMYGTTRTYRNPPGHHISASMAAGLRGCPPLFLVA